MRFARQIVWLLSQRAKGKTVRWETHGTLEKPLGDGNYKVEALLQQVNSFSDSNKYILKL